MESLDLRTSYAKNWLNTKSLYLFTDNEGQKCYCTNRDNTPSLHFCYEIKDLHIKKKFFKNLMKYYE